MDAPDDVQHISAFIALDSSIYAARIADELFASVERLFDFPKSGRVVPEFQDPAFREIIVRNYRVFYRITGPVIVVMNVLHGSRQLSGTRVEP